MKQRILLLFIFCLAFSNGLFAQTDKDERKQELEDKRAENKTKAKDKLDYNLFHRQILALKEFSEERRKIPALQKANKTTVKVVAIVDTTGDDDTRSKVLTGYIVRNMGEDATNIYEITFDRAQQKIISVKHTAEATEGDKDEDADEKPADTKKTIHKKTKDDNNDDDAPDKSKEKDDDKE